MSLTPTEEYRRIAHQAPAKLHKGIDARVNSVIGLYRRRGGVLSGFLADAEKIDAQAKQWTDLSDHLLRQRLLDLRIRFRRGGRDAAGLELEALAAVREVSDRQVGLRFWRFRHGQQGLRPEGAHSERDGNEGEGERGFHGETGLCDPERMHQG